MTAAEPIYRGLKVTVAEPRGVKLLEPIGLGNRMTRCQSLLKSS